jgi:hypothetical protein
MEAAKQFMDFLKFAFHTAEFKSKIKQLIPPEKIKEVSEFIQSNNVESKTDQVSCSDKSIYFPSLSTQQTVVLLQEIQEDLLQRSKRRKKDTPTTDAKMLAGIKLLADGLALLKSGVPFSTDSSATLRRELKCILPQLIALESSIK